VVVNSHSQGTGGINALLQYGADPNAIGPLADAPLDLVDIRRSDIIDILLKKKARCSWDYVYKDHFQRDMFSFPMDMDLTGNNDHERQPNRNPRLMTQQETVDSLMLRAVKLRCQDTILVLCEYGPNVNQVDQKSKMTLLMLVCKYAKHYDAMNVDVSRIAQALLSHGARPNDRDSIDGNTALHYAVMNHCYPAVKILLKNGADPNIKNDKGEKPIDLLNRIEGELR
jgi:ankyrin repeat protein